MEKFVLGIQSKNSIKYVDIKDKASVKTKELVKYKVFKVVDEKYVEVQDVIVLKKANDLEIVVSNNDTVTLENFYSYSSEVEFINNDTSKISILSNDKNIYQQIDPLTQMVFAKGDSHELVKIAKINDSLEKMIVDNIDLAQAPKFVDASSKMNPDMKMDTPQHHNMEDKPFMSNYMMIGLGAIAIGGIALAAGGGGGGGSSSSATTDSSLTAYFVDAAVGGIDYYRNGVYAGKTGTDGSFSYKTGETITFKAGNVTVGSITASEISSDGKVTPQDIVGVSRSNVSDTRVTKIAQFLQTLDSDGDASNGITVNSSKLATTSTNLEDSNDSTTLTAIFTTGTTIVSDADAMAHLKTTMKDVLNISNIDTTAPTVVITDNKSETTVNKASGDITYTFTFSEAVTGFTIDDVTVSNGTKGTFTKVNSTTYTLVVTPTSNFEGNVTVDVASGVAVDIVGNANTAATQAVQSVDTKALTAATISTIATDNIINSSEKTATVVVSGTNEAGATVSVNGNTASVSGTSWSYTFSADAITTMGEGAETVTVVSTDSAGNTTTSTKDITVDTVAPTFVSMSASSASGTITLTYDSSLDATHLPVVGDFSITTGGTANVVSGIVVSGNTITLTMTDSFSQGASISVSYTDANGDTTNAIQDSAGNDAASFSLSNGIVADGYVSGATIYIKVSSTTGLDTSKIETINGETLYNTGVKTDSEGNFFLPTATPSGSIVAIGGYNIDTGVPNTMPLKAPEGSTVINPLTTLVQTIVDSSNGTTNAESAEATVKIALGISDSVDLTTYNPIKDDGTTSATDLALQKAAATVATIVTMASVSDTGTINSTAATTVMTNFVTQITNASNSSTALTLDDAGTVSSLLNGVTLTVEKQSEIADASSALATATTLTAITATQSQYLDKIAPSVSTIVVITPTNDTTPSVKVNLNVTSTDGTAAVVGDSVALIVDGVQVSTLQLSAADIKNGYIDIFSTELTEGTHTISAKVIDQSGNSSSLYPEKTVVIDITDPSTPTINTVASDNIINKTEAANGVTISGTTEAGTTVAVNGHAATVNGTIWTYTLSSSEITTIFNNGKGISVVSTDAAGNTTNLTSSVTFDLNAPTAIATISNISYTNSGIITTPVYTTVIGNDNTIDVSGTLDVTLGQNETLVIYDGTTKLGVATISGTNWSFTTPGLSNSTHSLTARVEDSAGNAGTSSATAFTFTINTEVPTQTIQTITSTKSLTNDATPDISGTLSAALDAGSTVVIYDGTKKLGTADVSGTSWTYTSPSLLDGVHNLTAVVENSGGVQGTKSSTYSLTVDTVAPTNTTINTIATDNIINSTETTSKITGNCESGSTVNLTIGQYTRTATVTGTTWSYTLVADDITEMGQGSETISVLQTDAAGNVASSAVTKTITVDTIASTTVINDIATDNAINKAEKDSSNGVNITGTAGAYDKVTLTIGTVVKSVTADGSGNWTYTLSADDYKLIGAGATIEAIATDAAGNVSSKVTKAITVDTVAPALTVVLADSSDTGVKLDGKGNDTTPSFTFTAESGSTISYSVNGGNFTSFGTATGSVQTLTLDELSSDGLKTVIFKATDTAGNETTRTINYTLDTVIPTVVITDDESATTANIAGGNITYTFTFSEAATAFTIDDVTVVNGTKGTFTKVSPTVYTLVVTPTTGFEGNVTVDIASNVATDIAGNGNSIAIQSVQTVDMKAPTATITMSDTALKIGDTSIVTITFSETVTGFALEDLSSENGVLSNLVQDTNNPLIYTATFTPTTNIEDTTNVISLANTYSDIIGNIGTIATSANYSIDTKAPTVVITDNKTDVTNGNITYTFTFNEAVTGFTIDDVTVANGTKGTFTPVSSTVYTLVVTPTTGFEGNVTVDIASNVATDIAGNGNSVAIQSVQAVDMKAPTATITMSDTALKIGDTSTVTITFSEIVTGFSLADLSSDNGVLSNLVQDTNNPLIYTAIFTPTTNIEDTTNVISLATTYADIATNIGTVATSDNYTIDTKAPTITISAISGGYVNNAEDESPVTVSGTTTGVEDGQILTVTINSVNYTATVTSNAWTVNIPSADVKALSEGNVTVTASVSDVAGNPSIQATQTFKYDITAPSFTSVDTVTVSENTTAVVYTAVASDAVSYSLDGDDKDLFNINASTGEVTFKVAPDYENPTDAGANNLYNISVIAKDAADNSSSRAVAITVNNVDVTINDNITTDNVVNISEKSASTIALSGTNEPNATVTVNGTEASVNGTTWTYNLPTSTLTNGDNTITVVSGGQTVTKTLKVDAIAPTGIITDDKTDVTNGNITYTFTFNEAVTGFTIDDVTVANGTKGTFTPVSSTVYTLVVTPTAGFEGNVTVDIASNVATDIAGNGNSVAIQSVQTIDTKAPTVVITDNKTDVTNGNITYTFTFNEAVTGFTIDDVTVANGTKGTFTPVSSTVYTLVVTPITGFEGNVTVDIASNVATDIAGNGNSIAIQSVQTVDMKAPTATITMSDTALKIGDTSTVTITFSEIVTGFSLADLSSDNGVLSNLVQDTNNPLIYTAIFTPTTNIEDTTNVISLATTYADIATNIGTVATSDNYTIDTKAPSQLTYTLSNGTVTVANLESNATWEYKIGSATTWTTGTSTTFDVGTNGTVSFSIRQTDTTGNVSTIVSGTSVNGNTPVNILPTLWNVNSVDTDANGTLDTPVIYIAKNNAVNIDLSKYTNDSDGNTVTVNVVSFSLPAGLSVTNGVITGTTSANPDNNYIIVTLSDGVGTSTQQKILLKPISDPSDIVQVDGTSISGFNASTVFSGNGFYEVDEDDGVPYFGNIKVSGTSGTYNEYQLGDTTVDSTDTFTYENGTVTGSWGTETIVFSNARNVTSINGVTTTGLKAVDVTITTTNPLTVATTQDWWESGYTVWNSSTNHSDLITDLTVLKDLFLTTSNYGGYVWIDEDTQVKLTADGKLVQMVWDGTYNVNSSDGSLYKHFVLGNSIDGSWTLDSTYLTITATGKGTTAFKVVDGTIMQTEVSAVGSTNTTTWYFGVNVSTFLTTFTSVVEANHSPTLQVTSSGTPDTVYQGGEKIIDVVQLLINKDAYDIDGDSLGIAITNVNLSSGTYYYSLDGGTTWINATSALTGLTNVGVSTSGTSNALLIPSHNTINGITYNVKLKFDTNLDIALSNSTNPTTVIQFKAWDETTGNAFSQTTLSSLGNSVSSDKASSKIIVEAVSITSPTATIIMSDYSLIDGETAVVTITFSEAVSGFELADLNVQNGSLTNFAQSTTNPLVYTATFTPTIYTTSTTNVISLNNTYTFDSGKSAVTVASPSYTISGSNNSSNSQPWTQINNDTLLIAKGQAVNIDLDNYVYDAEGNPITITLLSVSSLPSGLTYNSTTHIISGTTTSTGSIQVSINDDQHTTGTTQTITIQPIDAPTGITKVLGTSIAVDSSQTFFGIDKLDNTEVATFNLTSAATSSTTDGTYQGYIYDGTTFVNDGAAEQFDIVSKTTTGATVTHGGTTETIVLSDAKEVTSINGIVTTGLKQVTATWTVTAQTVTVETTTDWWESGYTTWNGTASVAITDLTTLKNNLLSTSNYGGDVYINESLKVKLVGTTSSTSGTLVEMIWDGTYSTWTDSNNISHTEEHYVVGSAVTNGIWSLSGGYLTVTVPSQGTTAFKVDNGVLKSTEIPAVGSTYTETLYYGVDTAIFNGILEGVIEDTPYINYNSSDLIDFSAILSIGGTSSTATDTIASINQTTGIASFATNSGTTLADALADIGASFTAETDSLGEFAFFKTAETGTDYMLFISDGTTGVTSTDTLIKLVGVTDITSIDLTGGNLRIVEPTIVI